MLDCVPLWVPWAMAETSGWPRPFLQYSLAIPILFPNEVSSISYPIRVGFHPRSYKLQQLPSNIFVPKDGMEFWTNGLDVVLMFVCAAVSRQNSCLAAFCVCQKDRSTCCLPCAAVVRGLLLCWCGREEGEIHSFGTNLKDLYWLGIFVTRMYRYLEGGHAVLTFACHNVEVCPQLKSLSKRWGVLSERCYDSCHGHRARCFSWSIEEMNDWLFTKVTLLIFKIYLALFNASE